MHFSSTENVIWLEIVALAPTGAKYLRFGETQVELENEDTEMPK